MFHNFFGPLVHRSDKSVAPSATNPRRGSSRDRVLVLLGGQMKTRSQMSGLFRVLSIGLVLGLALMPTPLVAQAVTGTILGTVPDSSGGALPGATVTLLNQDTGFTPTVTSDSGGEFTAPLIPTGTYAGTGEISGVKKVSLANVHVGVDQKVKADLKLDVGQ